MTNAPHISVIDDDVSMRSSLERLVRSLGYRVQTFASAETFLASGDWEMTDCVVSDVQMGADEMTGLDLALRLSPRKRPPIILISAFADEPVCAQAQTVGARCLLKKPFDADTLIAQIDAALAA